MRSDVQLNSNPSAVVAVGAVLQAVRAELVVQFGANRADQILRKSRGRVGTIAKTFFTIEPQVARDLFEKQKKKEKNMIAVQPFTLPEGSVQCQPIRMRLEYQGPWIRTLALAEKWPLRRGFAWETSHKREKKRLFDALGVEGVIYKNLERDIFPWEVRVFTPSDKGNVRFFGKHLWEWVRPEKGEPFDTSTFISIFAGVLKDQYVHEVQAVPHKGAYLSGKYPDCQRIAAIPVRVHEDEPGFGSAGDIHWGFALVRELEDIHSKNPDALSYFDAYGVVEGEWRSRRTAQSLATSLGHPATSPVPLWIPDFPQFSTRDPLEVFWDWDSSK